MINFILSKFGKELVDKEEYSLLQVHLEHLDTLVTHYKSMAYDLMDRIPEDELVVCVKTSDEDWMEERD